MEIQNVTSYRVLAVGLAAGLMFAVMDGLVNANPVAQRLYSVYRPIARESVNAPLGLTFDLVSGIVMAFLFVAPCAGATRRMGPQRDCLRADSMVLPSRDGIGVAGRDVSGPSLGPALCAAHRSGRDDRPWLALRRGPKAPMKLAGTANDQRI